MLHRRVTDTTNSSLELSSARTGIESQSGHILEVRPQIIGWALLGIGQPTYFVSGRRAEEAGRSVARALARSGATVDLCISDRSGHIAGRYRFGGPVVDPAPLSAAETDLGLTRAAPGVLSHP